jgi:hypothetical protein
VAEEKFLLYCLVACYRFEHGLNPDTDADRDANMRDVSMRAQTVGASLQGCKHILTELAACGR